MPQGLGEYLVVHSHDETSGKFVEMEWMMPVGAFAPPPHRHPAQVESYEVPFKVERQVVRVRNFHRAGGRFDSFIERQHRFVTSDRFKGMKHPSTALAMATAWHAHRDLLVPTPPPLRAAVAVLGPIGARRGY